MSLGSDNQGLPFHLRWSAHCALEYKLAAKRKNRDPSKTSSATRAMRYLIGKIINATMGRGYSASASCSICKDDYRTSKPFVEGHAGILICRHCVQALREALEVASNSATTAALVRDPELADTPDPNPYSAPDSQLDELHCGLCGDALRLENNADNFTVVNNILWIDDGYALDVSSDSQGNFASDYTLVIAVYSN